MEVVRTLFGLKPGSVMGWCCDGCNQMVGALKRNVEEETVLVAKTLPETPCPKCEQSYQLGRWAATSIAASMGLRVSSESDKSANDESSL